MSPEGCPSAAELAEYHRGSLPSDAADRLADHLPACAGCEAALQALDAGERSVAAALRAGPGTSAFEGAAGPPESVGATVAGRYKLLEVLGEGGMGTVYMAQQTRPVRRLMALKVVKAGMDSRTVLARFEAERQALALMDHPNIAKVLDAGSTDAGRPYFVMELVKGVPITKYCDERRLTPRQRLELFLPVCAAVQHAHQKGVIHRDVKPNNVLIALYDGRPVPKVIDFGVAKATGQPLTDKTLVTGFGAVVGTPEYMAPEQAELNQLDIDTRADIYALAVLLYELLTGSTPLTRQRLGKAALLEVLRLVREEEPPKPSTRLSTADGLPSIAANRGTEPRRLAALVRGELDWIVMKGLDKDRTRRYDTAASLAADVQRHLAGDLVEARPASAAYRMRKFVRRNRGPAAAVGLLVAALTVGVAGTTLGLVQAQREQLRAFEAETHALGQARQAGEERDRAARAEAATRRALGEAEAQRDAKQAALTAVEEEQSTRTAVQRFFVDTVLAAGRPEGQEGGLGRDVSLRRAIDAAVPGIAGAFKGRPLVEAAVRTELGATYDHLGEPILSVEQYEQARRLVTAVRGPDHWETFAAASNLALAYKQAGRGREAIELAEPALRGLKASLGPDHPETLAAANVLAAAYVEGRRLPEAIGLFEEVLQARKARYGPDHPDTLTSMNNLANACGAARQYSKAIELHEAILRARRAALGPDHTDTLVSANNLAVVYRESGRVPEATRLFEGILPGLREKFGPDHPYTLSTLNSLGQAYLDMGRFSEAVRLHEEALRGRRARAGPDDPRTLAAMASLAVSYRRAGRSEDAVRLYEEVIPALKARYGPGDFYTLATENNLGRAYLDAGRAPDAVRLYEGILPTVHGRLGPDHQVMRAAKTLLGYAYREVGRPLEAVKLHQEVLAAWRSQLGPGDPTTLVSMGDLAESYLAADRPDEARPLLDIFLAGRKKLGPGQHPRLTEVLLSSGRRAAAHGLFVTAEGLLREALVDCDRRQPDTWETFDARSVLGGSLLGQGKNAEAEPLLLAGYEGMKQRPETIPGPARARLPEAVDRLVQLYEATGRPAEATRWREERKKYPPVPSPE
jgi:tetratricopeptide (TPR) repeat protein